MATAGPRPVPPGPAAERVPLSEVGEVLAALRERLLELPRAGFALPLQKIVEVQDLVAVASRPNWDYLRVKLREIDDDVAAAALESLPSAEGARLRAEAERAAERHREKVDPASSRTPCVAICASGPARAWACPGSASSSKPPRERRPRAGGCVGAMVRPDHEIRRQ